MEVVDKLKQFEDGDILIIWDALRSMDYFPEEPGPYNCTMEEWTELVYSEKSKRGI